MHDEDDQPTHEHVTDVLAALTEHHDNEQPKGSV